MFASLVLSDTLTSENTLKFSCKLVSDIVTGDTRSGSMRPGGRRYRAASHTRSASAAALRVKREARRRGRRVRVERRSGADWTERSRVHGGGNGDRKEQRRGEQGG